MLVHVTCAATVNCSGKVTHKLHLHRRTGQRKARQNEELAYIYHTLLLKDQSFPEIIFSQLSVSHSNQMCHLLPLEKTLLLLMLFLNFQNYQSILPSPSAEVPYDVDNPIAEHRTNFFESNALNSKNTGAC